MALQDIFIMEIQHVNEAQHAHTPYEEIGNVEEQANANLRTKDAINYGVQLGMSQGPKAFMGKKGNFSMLSGVAKSLVVFGIMIGVGLLILSKFQETTDANSTANTEIGNVTSLFTDLTTWGGIVLIVIMAYVIMRYLGVFD